MLHVESQERFKTLYCSESGVGIFPRGVGEQYWSVLDRIEEYSKRSLAKDSDILNGFMGILRIFESSELGLRHLYGTPFLSRPEDQIGGNKSSLSQSFIAGLLWQPKVPASRRVGFPSWSWTGWHGPVEWVQRYHYLKHSAVHNQQSYSDVEVQLTSSDSQIWCDVATTFKNQIIPDKNIRIRTSMAIVESIKNTSPSGEALCDTRLRLRDGKSVAWRFRLTGREDLCAEECLALILAYSPSGLEQRLAIMIVQRVGEMWERVGLGWMGSDNNKLYSKMGICEHEGSNIPDGAWAGVTFGLQWPVKSWKWFELI